MQERINNLTKSPTIKHVGIDYSNITPLSIERVHVSAFDRMCTLLSFLVDDSTTKEVVFDTTEDEHARLLSEFDTYKTRAKKDIYKTYKG